MSLCKVSPFFNRKPYNKFFFSNFATNLDLKKIIIMGISLLYDRKIPKKEFYK